MAKALSNFMKPMGYVLAIGCVALFASRVYRTFQEAGAPPSTAVTTGASTNSAVTNRADTNSPALVPGEELRPRAPDMGRVMTYAGLAFLGLVGLSLLVARDLSRYFANRADDFIFNDNLIGVHNPEYEEAERVWANGDYLDSIQLMRDYLKKHPREQYVALRIAEIYEANLGNYLAAALEYEEILKKKLPAERWGWAAIHLANLYSGKLNKTEEATALLRRIVDDYGQTAAAKKARERLGLPELASVTEVKPVVEKPEPPPASAPAPSNLPPGFRPK